MHYRVMIAGYTAVLVGLLSLSFASSMSADLSPLSLIVSENESEHHVFECTVTGAERADVRIDNTPFEDQEIKRRGIEVSAIRINSTNGMIIATISIPATIENNDTSIQCISINFTSSDIILSTTATYLVQGLLEAPSTEFMAVNESFLSFVWRAPFTLDITDVEPDILFYSFQESLTDSMVNVTRPGEYVFPNVAVTVEFSVSAWNIVGKGVMASATHQPCAISIEQQTVNSADVMSEVIFQEDTPVSLSLSLNWPVPCIPLFSVQLVGEGQEGEGVTHSHLVPSVSGSGGERQLHLTLPLQDQPVNAHYTAHLTSISDQREVTAINIPYSTHDIQLVIISYTLTSITTSCRFAVGSPAVGCSVHILSAAGFEVEASAMRGNDTDGQGLPLIVAVTVDELETGLYTVTVYDIESNGETSTDGAPAHTETVNIAQPTTSPTANTDDTSGTIPSSSTTKPDAGTCSISNGVAIGLSILGVTVLTGCVVLAAAILIVHRGRQKQPKDIAVANNAAYGVVSAEPEYETVSPQ